MRGSTGSVDLVCQEFSKRLHAVLREGEDFGSIDVVDPSTPSSGSSCSERAHSSSSSQPVICATRRIVKTCVTAATAQATIFRSACLQFHGSSSGSRLCGVSAMRASTSASQASGSTSLSFAVMISVVMAAARSAPRSEPAKSHDRRPSAKPRSARSAALFGAPCQGAPSSPVEIRAGELSLQPEALGAGQEATNDLKHSEKRPL